MQQTTINNKYSRVANSAVRNLRARRSVIDNRSTCSLYIRTDPTLWRHIRRENPDVRLFLNLIILKSKRCLSCGFINILCKNKPLFFQHKDPSKRSEVNMRTREELLSLIAQHVTAVNYIYRSTKFDGRLEHRNIKFEVQRVKVRTNYIFCLNYLYMKSMIIRQWLVFCLTAYKSRSFKK